MSFPCLNAGPVDNTEPTITITNCGTTLTNGILVVGFDAQNYPADSRVDLWVKHSGINGGAPQDVASSVLVGDGMITNNAANLIPQDGSDFTVCLRVLPDGDLDFASAPDAVSCTFTSATIETALKTEFDSFEYMGITSAFEEQFGHTGDINHVNVSAGTTRISVTGQAAAQAAINNMNPGEEVVLLPSSYSQLELSSTSGSDALKKVIRGESDCFGNGPVTSSSAIRFNATGDHFAVAGVEDGGFSTGQFANLLGSDNWFFDNKLNRSRGFRFTPQGTFSNPQTTGNKIAGNNAEGDNDDYFVHLFSPYSNQSSPSVRDTLIACNTINKYGRDDGIAKAITDVSWYWSSPISQPGGEIPSAEVFVEVAWNHFIDCPAEIHTIKTRRQLVHHNYADCPNGWWSARTSDDLQFYCNVIRNRFANGTFAQSGRRIDGFYNVNISSGTTQSKGPAYSHAASEASSAVAAGGRFTRRIPMEDHDWRFNWYINENGLGAAAIMRMLIDSTHEPAFPTQNNVHKENFYEGTPAQIEFYGSAGVPAATLADWDSRNPNSLREDQHIAVNGQFPETVNMPEQIPLRLTDINGSSLVAECPPWIGPEGDLIRTT